MEWENEERSVTSPPRSRRSLLSRPDLQRSLGGLHPRLHPLRPPHLHLCSSHCPPSPPGALYPPQPRRLSATRPHCLWRVIDFLPAPEKRAASARLEVTHFPGAFSSLLIKRSPGPPHSLLIHSAIRATPPLRTPSIGWRAGGRARLAEEQRRIFAQHFGALLQLFES